MFLDQIWDQVRGGVAGLEVTRRRRPGGRARRREQVPLVGAGARRSAVASRHPLASQFACVAAVAGLWIKLAVLQQGRSAEVRRRAIRVRLRMALAADHPAATICRAIPLAPRIARRRATVAGCKTRRGGVCRYVASVIAKGQAATAPSRRPTCAQNDRQQHQVTHEEPPGESRTPGFRTRHVSHEPCLGHTLAAHAGQAVAGCEGIGTANTVHPASPPSPTARPTRCRPIPSGDNVDGDRRA